VTVKVSLTTVYPVALQAKPNEHQPEDGELLQHTGTERQKSRSRSPEVVEDREGERGDVEDRSGNDNPEIKGRVRVVQSAPDAEAHDDQG
jgi:hypothetical protein